MSTYHSVLIFFLSSMDKLKTIIDVIGEPIRVINKKLTGSTYKYTQTYGTYLLRYRGIRFVVVNDNTDDKWIGLITNQYKDLDEFPIEALVDACICALIRCFGSDMLGHEDDKHKNTTGSVSSDTCGKIMKLIVSLYDNNVLLADVIDWIVSQSEIDRIVICLHTEDVTGSLYYDMIQMIVTNTISVKKTIKYTISECIRSRISRIRAESYNKIIAHDIPPEVYNRKIELKPFPIGSFDEKAYLLQKKCPPSGQKDLGEALLQQKLQLETEYKERISKLEADLSNAVEQSNVQTSISLNEEIINQQKELEERRANVEKEISEWRQRIDEDARKVDDARVSLANDIRKIEIDKEEVEAKRQENINLLMQIEKDRQKLNTQRAKRTSEPESEKATSELQEELERTKQRLQKVIKEMDEKKKESEDIMQDLLKTFDTLDARRKELDIEKMNLSKARNEIDKEREELEFAKEDVIRGFDTMRKQSNRTRDSNEDKAVLNEFKESELQEKERELAERESAYKDTIALLTSQLERHNIPLP